MGLKNAAVLAVIWVLALAGAQRAFASTTTITAATGGSAISATNAGSAWTTLTGPVLTESSSGAIGTGTIILTAPSGFAFNTSATVTVKVKGGSTASRNINDLANNSTIPVTVAASTLTVTITAASTGTLNANTLTWQNIQVRPTAGTPLASGALTESGTCTFQGLTGSWGTLTEVAGPAARLAFTTQPGGATAGAVLVTQPVVSSRDQFGNSSTNGLPANSFVAVTLTGGTGPLQGTTSVNLGLSGGKGTAAFTNLRIDAAGNNKQLTVTSTNGLTSDVSSVFTVSPAAASKLVMSVQPAVTAVAGVPFAQQPVVVIQDAFNNLRSSDTLVVTATRNAGAGALLGTTNIAAVGGVAIFTGLAHPYATNITLAFTSGSLTATNSSVIAVSSGPFSQLQLLLPGETAAPATPTGKTGTPTAQTAGTAFSGRVNAADAYWNTANTNVAAVGLTCSDTTAALPASVALVSGTNSFSVTMKVAATQTVTATYSTMNTTSAPVVVGAGAAIKLLALMPGETAAPGTPNGKTGTPTAQTAGTPFTVTVNAVDANWNLAVSTHTIAITSSDTNAALPSSAALSGGTGAFSVTFKTAGSWTVTVTDTSAGPLSSNTGTLTTANPGLFSKLQVLLPGETAVPGSAAGNTGAPSAQTAGLAFSGRVNAVDAWWNIANTNVAAVALTNSDVTGVIPASVALVNGTNSFSVTMKAAGSRTVTATYLTINATSAPVVINAGTAAKLLLLMPGETSAPGTPTGKTGTPTAQTAGTPFTVTVNAVDTNWNLAVSTHTIAITASDTNAALPSNAALSGGTGSFSVTFKTAGSWTVTATDTSAGPLSSNTGTLTRANPGLFSKLQVLLPGETAVPGSAAGKTGAPSAQTAGLAFSGRVNAVDAYWNIANTNVAAVALTNSDATGLIPASVALVNGTNSFSVTMKAAGGQTVTATYLAINGTSAPVVVNGGVTAKLLVLMPGETAAPGTPNGKTGTPTAQTAGTPFAVTVNAVDTNWNLVVSTHTIAITASDTNAVLPGSAALAGGTGSFSVTFKTAGSWNVTATDTSAGPLSSNTGTLTSVNPGLFTKLQVLLPGETAVPGSAAGKTGAPSAQTAGLAFSGRVNAVDAYWNIANTNVAVVALTNSDITAVMPASVALVNGTNSFSVTMKAAGSQTVAAAYLAINATSAPVVVNVGAAAKLLVLMPGETPAPGTLTGKTGTPTAQTAGTPFTVTVHAVDTNWNLIVSTHTIAITASDTNAVLPGSSALVGGTGTFSVTFKTAGSWNITATDTSGSPLSASTGSLTTANPGVFARLQVLLPGETAAPVTPTGKIGTPSAQTAGTVFSGKVSAVDVYWNIANTNVAVVGLTNSDPTAVLPASVALVNGTNSFNVTMKAVGSQTVTATYLTMNATSAPVQVTAGAALKLLVLMPGETAAPGTVSGKAGTPLVQTAGTPFSVTVNAVDANWNLAVSTHTIAITSTDTNAVMPGSAALSGGTGTLSVTFKTAGNWTATATDTSASPLSPNTGSLTAVSPGAFAKLQVLLPGESAVPGSAAGKTGTPSAQTAGVAFGGRINAVDAYWNVATTTNPVVSLACSDATAVLPASVVLVNGTNTAGVTMNLAGSQTVTATYLTMNTTSAPVVINAGTAAKLLVLMPGETPAPGTPMGRAGTPTAQTAGTPFTVTVNAVDTNWNLTTSTHTIAITASDSNAVLPSNAALSGGTGSFSVTFKTAGSWTVTATDTSAGPLSSNTGSPTTATPGAFAKLQVLMPGETGAPGTATGKAGVAAGQTAGTPFAVVVSAVDANWNSISTNDTVRLSSSDTNAVLPADTALVGGTKALSVTLNTAGARTVTASDVTHGGITTNTSTAITISPGPFAKLQLLMPGETAAAGTTNGKTGTPGARTVGTAFNLTVNAVDAQWNILSTNHTVAITSSDSYATLPTNAALISGTKTFSLTFKTAGSQTATATDVTDGTKTPATSPLTQVNAGAFAKLQLLVPGETSAPGTTTGKSGAPFNQISNIAFTVTVSGVDANWNVVNTNDTIRFTSSDNRAVLPTNAPLVAGTRNFSVTLMTVGAATLTVSNVTHTGITANTSSAVTVVAQGYVTNSLNFTNATRQALLADGWSFIATLPGGGTRNTEITNSADGALVSYDQVAHPGVLRIPTDTGDLWGTANNTRNSLFHNLSSNWVSLRLDVSFTPTNDYQQAQLALYQDDDNYIEIGHAYSSDLGGEVATLAREDGGVQTSWSPLSLSQARVSASRMQLRLDRDLVTDKVSALYSLDGTNWTALGQTCQALTNAQVCLWTGGSTGGLPNCDLRRLDIITSSTPLNPILVAQPQHLVFNAVAGQPCTNLQQLRVVARRASVTQAYTITNNASWLSVSTTTGNTPGFCDVSVNTTGLAAGTYQGLLTCSAPGATSAVASVTLIVNPAVRARVASWRGARAGAMTVWVDDSQPTAFDELTADGFQGSYLLWGVTPIPVWATNYYLAGMELGGHTVDHLCLALDEPATRYELETNIASICAASPQPSSNLITFAFPCGFAPVASQVIASDYYLAVHGYNINQLEDASPYDFMNLKTFNSHEHTPYPPADFKPLVDAAIAQGKWYNMVLHTTNNSDGAITRAVGKDIWVATGGAVTKYILQRDRTVITNYQEGAGQISFSYYRLPLDASIVRSFETAIGPQDALTFQVDTTGTNAVYSATLNGKPTPCTVKMMGGRTLMVFDTPVTTAPQIAVLQLVSNRAPSLPVQTNQAVHQLATLTVTNTAADLDAPPQVLTYSLLNPPTGAQIDANGVIQWTPAPAQNPGPYLLTTVVADNGQPPLRATNSFTVSVQLQDALQLPPASDLTANAGQALVVTNTANYNRSVNPYATNTLSFNYANRDALLADGWSFIATTPLIGPRDTEITNPADGGVISYDQTAHPGSLRIPCDVGDLWGTLNSSRNALLRNLQTNWVSLRLGLTFPPTQNYQQVHLSLYQDDDNYLQVGFAFNSGLGGQAATLILETNATPNHFYTALYAITNIYLRLDQDSTTGDVTGLYSLDQMNWAIIGTYNQTLGNPRLEIWTGGSPDPWTNGLPNLDLRRLDVVVSNNMPTVLTYILLNPPSGATIDNNGIIRWTPLAGLGPTTNVITTVVTDNNQPPLSATNSIRVIVRGALTVVADNQSRAYGSSNPLLTGTLTGVRNGDNITADYATTARNVSPVGTYAIVPVLNDPSGKLTNYTVFTTNGTLTITPATLTCTADNQSRLYGQTNSPFTATFTGFVNGENSNLLTGTLAGNTSAQTNSPVGVYPITVSGQSASNYVVNYLPGTLSVGPSPLWVTASNASRPYGYANPAFSAGFSGFVNGETANALGGVLIVNTAAQTNSSVGAYPIVPSGLASTNYALNYSNGTLTVTAYALMVIVNNQSRAYGTTNPVLTGTLTGVQNGDNIAASYSTLANTNSAVGAYTIVPALADPGHKLTNYSVTASNGLLTIGPTPLWVTANNASRPYGQANPAFSAGFSGLVNGETSNVLGGVLVLTTSAQTNSPVSAYPIFLGGLTSTNYALNYSNGTLTVTAYALTVRADNQSRTYGNTNALLTGTLTGVQSGDNITADYSTLANTNSPVGVYAIIPALADPGHKLTNYSVTVSNGLLTVGPTPLWVSASNASRPYGQANPVFTADFSGFVNGETSNALGGALVFNTPAQTHSAVGTYPILPGGLTSTNYALNYSNGTLTVNAAPLAVAADNQSKTYGAANPALTGHVTGLQNNDNIVASFATTADSGSRVGVYPITASLSDPNTRLGNYQVTTNTGTLTVVAATLTVTAENKSRVYGATNPVLSATISGFVHGESGTVVAGSPSLTTAATKGSNVGTYPITAALGSLGATNYAFSFVNGTLTVTPAALIGTADNQSRFYGQTNPPFTVTYGGFVNGENAGALTGTLSGATSAQTNSPVGVYPITVSGQSSANYAISYLPGTLTVSPSPLWITASNASRAYGQSNPPFSAAFSGFVNGESTNALGGVLVFNTSAQTNSPVGTYPIVPTGLASTNYALSYSNGTLSVTAYALMVSGDNQSRTYGATNPVLTGTLTGVQNGDGITASYSTVASPSSPVGGYPIVPALADPGHKLTNYSVTFSNGTLTVVPAELTALVDNQNRLYGETNPAFTGTLIGVLNQDAISAGYTTAAGPASSVGTYPISPVLSDPDHRLTNYNLTVYEGTLAVFQAWLAIKADDQSRPYGGADPVLTITLNGLKNGDDIRAICWSTAGPDSPVGSYAIYAYLYDPDLKVGNYILDYEAGTLTVTRANSAITIRTSANPSPSGSNITFTATLSEQPPGGGIPTGHVQFLADAIPLGAPALVNNGVATFNTTALAHGYRLISAQYVGDGNFNGNTGALSPNQVVNTAPRGGILVLSTVENQSVSLSTSNLLANCTDAELDVLTVTAVSPGSAQGGTVSCNGLAVIYFPPTAYTGSDSFTFTVSDSYGATATGNVFVTIEPPGLSRPFINGLTRQVGGNVQLRCSGVPGQTYLLQASTALNNWSTVSTNTADASGVILFLDQNSVGHSLSFYRLAVP